MTQEGSPEKSRVPEQLPKGTVPGQEMAPSVLGMALWPSPHQAPGDAEQPEAQGAATVTQEGSPEKLRVSEQLPKGTVPGQEMAPSVLGMALWPSPRQVLGDAVQSEAQGAATVPQEGSPEKSRVPEQLLKGTVAGQEMAPSVLGTALWR